jgi:hypothetical protein
VTPISPHELETLESISQNEVALDLFLRMARISRGGGMNNFLRELVESDELDSETKAAFAEVATNRPFLLALDDYVHRTRVAH